MTKMQGGKAPPALPAGRAPEWGPSPLRSIMQRLYMARGGGNGNPDKLRSWYDDASKSHINWGSAGDFDRCVAIASAHMSDEEAKGFCNLRHQDATGHPPGHAPSEQPSRTKHAAQPARQEQTVQASQTARREGNSSMDFDYGEYSQRRTPVRLAASDGAVLTGRNYKQYVAPPDDTITVSASRHQFAQDSGKKSKQEANYVGRAPNPQQKCCRLCAHYHGGDSPWCDVVSGKISPLGVSDEFKAASTKNSAASSSRGGDTLEFRYYSHSERQAFAKKGWAIPDNDSGGAFPITDEHAEEDIKNALKSIGLTDHPRASVIRHIRKRAKETGHMDLLAESTKHAARLEGIKSTDDELIAQPIQFSSGEFHDRGNGTYTWIGKAFETGPRRDMHGIACNPTRADLQRMHGYVVDIGSGHPEAPSVLDGELGYAELFVAPDNPDELWAEATVPEFMHDILAKKYGSQVAPVSMILHRWTLEPKGLDFVGEPNVVDAGLQAAFSRYTTGRGQQAVQRMHDIAVHYGAVCNEPDADDAKMASRAEASFIQATHDNAVANGARCELRLWEEHPTGKSDEAPNYADTGLRTQRAPAGGKPGQQYDSNLRQWQAPAPASMGPKGVSGFARGGKRMDRKMLGFLTRLFSDPELAEYAAGEIDDPPGYDPRRDDDGARPALRMSRELEEERSLRRQYEQELRDTQRNNLMRDANLFAETEVHENRSLPNEQDDLADLYVMLGMDDLSMGPLKFSTDGGRTQVTSTRVDKLRAFCAAREPHWLTKEQLTRTVSPEVLMAVERTRRAGEPPADDPAEVERLLESSTLGRAAKHFKQTGAVAPRATVGSR